MVTAILPSLTNDPTADNEAQARFKAHQSAQQSARNSAVFSVTSELTITPERYVRSVSEDRESGKKAGRPSALAGYVGLFTGCGALVALVLFLPLPARFGEKEGVTPGQAVADSFYVVAAVSAVVAVFVAFGLRGLKGEEGKGWGALFGTKKDDDMLGRAGDDGSSRRVSHLELINFNHTLITDIRLFPTFICSKTPSFSAGLIHASLSAT